MAILYWLIQIPTSIRLRLREIQAKSHIKCFTKVPGTQYVLSKGYLLLPLSGGSGQSHAELQVTVPGA